MSGSLLAARLQVLAAAALFSTGGAAIKATTLDAWQVAGLRSALAAVVLWIFLGHEARRRPSRGELWVAAAYALALPGYVLANKLTTAANTIFLYSTAPFWVLLLAPWLLAERWTRRELALMGLLLAGGATVLIAPQAALATASRPALGNAVAAGSSLVWALTVIGLRALSRTGTGGSARRAVVWGNALAFGLMLPLLLPLPAGGLAFADAAVIGYLGVVQVGLAYVLLLSGLRRVPALEASLLLLLEPAINPLWAWWLHDERPGAWVLAGGAAILVALALYAMRGGDAGEA